MPKMRNLHASWETLRLTCPDGVIMVPRRNVFEAVAAGMEG